MAGSERLRVGVIMGSDSDMSTMQETGAALRAGGLEPTVDYEFRVVSAHRTPEWMTQYAHEAEERGLQVIIPGAGGSAHLPGMVASETVLPVAGVAVTSHPNTMNRALGSLIGMPEGKPLATFQSKRGAYQAGVFAARILNLDANANRVGIVAASEQDQETMNHVGRALGVLGLRETVDYQYLEPREVDFTRGAAWAKDNNFAVLVGSANDNDFRIVHGLEATTKVPVLGVAVPKNPDVMSLALDTLVNGSDPVAAFQASSGAFNAGLKAARVLALRDPALRQNIVEYNDNLKVVNKAKDAIMSRIGDVAYVELSTDKVALQTAIDAEIAAGQA